MVAPNSLGRYELTAQIARGGMSDVFEARDRLLDRKVAVKILHDRFAETDTFVARFRKEARAVANLSHPNVVSVYDWGEEDGTYFMVMELVKGRSLRDIIQAEGKLLPRRATEIAAEIAKALDAAHRSGVIHRDIKPGNILLTTDGSVKVTDFGVARARNASEGLTKVGSVIGTATYFSPEQASGDPADERSDIYSLGVVLYEMLVGRPPFRGESPVSVAYQHVTAEVVPPSRLNTDVSLELENVVMRALDKDPDRRYGTAADIHHDLLVLLQGRPSPVSQAPVAPPARAPTPQDLPPAPPRDDDAYRRQRGQPRQPSQLPFILTAVLLAAGVVLGAYLLLNSLSNDPAPSTTVPVVTIAIPNVTGLSEEEARIVLQEAGFLVTTSREFSEAPEDSVIRTEPAVGTVAEEESQVNMVVSDGPALLQVPTVVGSTRERAIGQLRGQGFAFTERTARHDTIGVGLVISQDPAGEAKAQVGTVVELVISAGPQPIEMPRVIGLSRDRAEGMLEGLGLEVSTTSARSNEVPPGVVARQEPAPGADVNPGWSVQLVISEGPEMFVLEELAGQPVADVIVLLGEAGMQVQVIQEPSPSHEVGVVIRTDPPGGTELPVGEMITLYESTGPDLVEVPDLTGATPEEAEATLAGLGLILEVAASRAAVDAPELDGRIARQAPGPGEVFLRGETVLVVLGDYTAPVVDSEGDNSES
ncbi:MAG: Stk1 family PASTA domain-containing Ser/Thr kinase [bacterium]|nr:Stk1 family PASTA domain-containing Ser/Thr kinase [bacterium]MDE0351231.1 Stk1 family PASTA domain-containing Ser/Thr kinase [bacterium]